MTSKSTAEQVVWKQLGKVSAEITEMEKLIYQIDIDTIKIQKKKKEKLSPEQKVADKKYIKLTTELQELEMERIILIGKLLKEV